MNYINDLYNLTLFLLRGTIVIVVVTVVYIIGIIIYTRKYRIPIVKSGKIKINNMTNKENI